MAATVENVRDFVVQIEKTLSARRLYLPGNAAYQDANDRLLEKCRTAAEGGSFTILVGPADLFFDKSSILNRPKPDDSFFFPIFRDGLRALTFTSDVTADDLDSFISVLETRDRDLGPTDDLVNQLWRHNLSTVQHKAVDGIGESAEEGEAGQQLHALVTDVSVKIKGAASSRGEPKLAYRHEGTLDSQYDTTAMRRSFEANPSALQLSSEQAAQIRAELGEDRDGMLVERFIEILFVIVRSPLKSIDAATIAPVFQQLADRYWNVRDYARVAAILSHVQVAASDAPNPEYRAVLADVIRRFLTVERLNLLFLDFVGGALAPQIAARLWDLVPDEVIWPILIDSWSRLPEGETRVLVLNALRRRIATNMELLRQALVSADPSRVRAALALIDERSEKLFANDLIHLTAHPEESIRLKGLAAAMRLGGDAALEAMWKAVQRDPSKSVRLYAFRAMSTVKWPGLGQRLEDLVTDPQFAERPLWEREKYVRLLGTIAGADVAPLFESWIPAKRWRWAAKDLEELELALRGLGATGEAGFERVRQMAAGGGKPGEIARKVLDSLSRAEIGEGTIARRMPTLSNVPLPEKR
jgi:hypothetical protein